MRWVTLNNCRLLCAGTVKLTFQRLLGVRVSIMVLPVLRTSDPNSVNFGLRYERVHGQHGDGKELVREVRTYE